MRRGTGRDVVAFIAAVEKRQEAAFWTRFENELTPEEKARILRGSFHSFRRPVQPYFTRGDWLHVRPNLRVRIADVEWTEKWGGAWRIRLDRVEDYRSTGSPIRTYGEDPDSMANTMRVIRSNPPEPHGPPEDVLRRYAEQAEIKRAGVIREAIEG